MAPTSTLQRENPSGTSPYTPFTLTLPDISKVPPTVEIPEFVDLSPCAIAAKLYINLTGRKKEKIPAGIHTKLIEKYLTEKIDQYFQKDLKSQFFIRIYSSNITSTIDFCYISEGEPIYYKPVLEKIEKECPEYKEVFNATIALIGKRVQTWENIATMANDMIDSGDHDFVLDFYRDYDKNYHDNDEDDEKKIAKKTKQRLKALKKALEKVADFPKITLSKKKIETKLLELPEDSPYKEHLHTWISNILPYLTYKKHDFHQWLNEDMIVDPGEICSILYDPNDITSEYYNNTMEMYMNDGYSQGISYDIPLEELQTMGKKIRLMKSAMTNNNLYELIGTLRWNIS